jgi:hypothetical protein
MCPLEGLQLVHALLFFAMKRPLEGLQLAKFSVLYRQAVACLLSIRIFVLSFPTLDSTGYLLAAGQLR